MTTYYCKCGRIVRKSTGADNTGNRLEGYAPGHECFGCPYVMPWGENRYEAGKGFVLEVKGYECRMSQDLEYASRFSGSVKDKCTCSIVSLDFDFLERVSSWIAGTYPGGELFGGFDRSKIRAVEYCSNGRYRMTVTCAQNKAGVAAKAALLEQFFNPDGSRRDLTPEQEQEKILNDIKAATHPELPQPYRLGDEYISQKDGRRIRLVDTAREGEKLHWYQIQENLGNGWKPANSSVYPHLEDALATLAAFVRLYKLVPAPAEIVDECGGPDEEEKETTPCAASPNHQSPTPTAAPSKSPGPGTAPGACTGTNAPGGRMETPDGSKLYFKKTAAAAACLKAEPAERPGFDYSGMSARTVDMLHVAERMIREARRDYVIAVAQAVSIAHEELCGGVVRISDNSKHGNRGEDAFRSWCQFIGLSKTTAYQLLQVDALMQGATPEEQAVLEQASPSLLYAAAKPSAPAELVQGVKEGSITTHKQYQELQAQLKAEKDRADTAEAQRDAARSEKAGLAADCNRLGKAASDAKRRAEAAEAQRDAALADVDGLSQQNTMLQSELKASEDSAAEKDARIRELEARPVEVVGADPEDIARWRAEGAAQEGALQTVRQAVETCELLLKKAAEELPRLPDGQYRTAMQSVCKLYHWLGQLIALKDKEDQNVL